MPIPDLRQLDQEELSYVTEALKLLIAKWYEWGVPPTGEVKPYEVPAPLKRAWQSGYAAAYANCADGLEFALTDFLEETG